jgi:hypothetical protein
MIANNTHSVRFDEQFVETYPIAFGASVAIATLSLDVAQLVAKNPAMTFHDSFDDLDYLKYCILDIFPENKVALVYHERCPVPGVDICIDPRSVDPSRLLVSALCNLGLTTQSLSWVNPDCLLKLQTEWGFQSPASAQQLC